MWLLALVARQKASPTKRKAIYLPKCPLAAAACAFPPATMRLITHNLLTCNKKGVETGFPLRIEPEQVEVVESEFNAEFVRKMLAKLDWAAFLAGAEALKVADGLPRALTTDAPVDEETLRKIHQALMDVHVKQGKLVCPESGREFPIVDGIPNMLLNEDEV